MPVPSDTSPNMLPTPTHAEFIREQAKSTYCRARKAQANRPNTEFHIDHHGLLVRRSTIDGAVQVVVPPSLQQRILTLGNYPMMARHPGQRRMNDTLRSKFFWPHMASDVCETLNKCGSCAHTQNRYQHKRPLQLSPPSGPPKVVAMNIFGPLTKTTRGNQYVEVATDRYSKITRAIPTSKTTSMQIANIFRNQWIKPYGISSFTLTDNSLQFGSKFFATLCGLFGVKHLTTTAYYPQTNGRAKRFSRTKVNRPRHYVAEHQHDWNRFVQLITYAYNAQEQRSINTTPYSLVLSRQSPGPSTIVAKNAVPTEAHGETSIRALRQQLKKRVQALRTRTDAHLRRTQQGYRSDHDRRVCVTPTFRPGDLVFINSPPLLGTELDIADNIAAMKHNKLMPRSLGSFHIIAVSSHFLVIDEYGVHNFVSIDRATNSFFPRQ